MRNAARKSPRASAPVEKPIFLILENPIFSSERRQLWIHKEDVIQSTFESPANVSYSSKRRICSRVRSAKGFQGVPTFLVIKQAQKLRVGSKQFVRSPIGNAVLFNRLCQDLQRSESHTVSDVIYQFQLYSIFVGGNLVVELRIQI